MTGPGRSWRANVPLLFAALMVALAIEVTFPPADPREDPGFAFALEVDISSAANGWAQVFVDTGHGFNVDESSISAVRADGIFTPHRFLLKRGRVRRLRLDPFNGVTSGAELRSARVVEIATGAVVCAIGPEAFRPNDHVAQCVVAGDVVRVVPAPGANDPQLVAAFVPPLRLGAGRWDPVTFRVARVLLVLIVSFAGGYATRRFARTASGRTAVATVRSWCAAHPRAALAFVAAAAATVCCHPLIFAGRSLVSPGYGLPLLHPDHPGSSVVPRGWHYVEDPRASDIGAMLWQHLPYSVVQHRALVKEGVLPLWNRHNSCGAELLGQGQSMLGDPFHVPVILAGGASWAWDAKFVVARFLFAWGCGLAAWAAVRRLGAAGLLAFAAPFFGFFSYRLSHPAVFTFCYAPWILVAWLEVAAVRDSRRLAGWMGLVLLATACVLTSGTAKESVMLAVTLNAVGFTAALVAMQSHALRRRMLLLAVVLGVAGVLMLAPGWMSFAAAMRSSWTSNTGAYALRVPPSQAIGVFDALFFSEFLTGKAVGGPSANVVVLLGVLALLVTARRGLRDATTWACGLGAAAALSLAFDVPWLPTRWILAVPGLAQVGHVGYTFICVAIPMLVVVAAKGFVALDGLGRPALRRSVVAVVVLFLALVVWQLVAVSGSWSPADAPAASSWREFPDPHGFFLLCVLAMLAGTLGMAVAGSWINSQRGRAVAGMLLLGASLIPMLGRHGQWLDVGRSEYFVNPAPRADLAETSPVLRELQARTEREPARVLGLNGHLFPGFTALFGLEGPNGPDALVSRHYRELVEAAGLARPDVWYFESGRADLEPRQRILDLLNVRHFVSCPESPDVPSWLRPLESGELTLFESATAWPRAFLVDAAVPCDGATAVIEHLLGGDGRPFAAMSPSDLADAGLHAPPGTEHRFVAARDYALGSNDTTFTIDAPAGGIAVLTETWLPGAFRAEVNGAQVEVLRVNHAFKGVRIPGAGTHRIRFVFDPPHLRAATGASIAGVLLAVASLAWALGRPFAAARTAVATKGAPRTT